jgi:SPX domain-containing protein involved in vacuolar polyphosphate accumulation
MPSKIPYGVFEVKVAGGEDPTFIEELQQSGAIVKAPKFSKFLTGCAVHNASIVPMLPWWSEGE